MATIRLYEFMRGRPRLVSGITYGYAAHTSTMKEKKRKVSKNDPSEAYTGVSHWGEPEQDADDL